MDLFFYLTGIAFWVLVVIAIVGFGLFYAYAKFMGMP